MALIAALALICMPGCSGDQRPGAEFDPNLPRATPILVFGADGLEWDVVLPLLSQGRMPYLAGLMERGCFGELKSFRPTYSPVLWTSVATGKTLQKHGIQHFAYRDPQGQLTLFNSTDRRTKALWNILSDYGRSVTSIGWWMTYPAEEINGVMVAQTNTEAQFDTRGGKYIWKGSLLKGVAGQVYPPDRQNEMMTVLEEVEGELPYRLTRVFGSFPHHLSPLGRRLWDNCQWSFRADATYVQIALQLAAEGDLPDLTLLYLGGTDVVGHRFWRYMQPDVFHDKPAPDQIANFAGVINDYYAYADRALGQVLAEFGEDATIFVLSDHGMHAYNRMALFNAERPPDDVNSGHHKDAPPGIWKA
jgi:predicted AlkP superfamily pyrophosphatase or phosphodiesterase